MNRKERGPFFLRPICFLAFVFFPLFKIPSNLFPPSSDLLTHGESTLPRTGLPYIKGLSVFLTPTLGLIVPGSKDRPTFSPRSVGSTFPPPSYLSLVLPFYHTSGPPTRRTPLSSPLPPFVRCTRIPPASLFFRECRLLVLAPPIFVIQISPRFSIIHDPYSPVCCQSVPLSGVPGPLSPSRLRRSSPQFFPAWSFLMTLPSFDEASVNFAVDPFLGFRFSFFFAAPRILLFFPAPLSTSPRPLYRAETPRTSRRRCLSFAGPFCGQLALFFLFPPFSFFIG